MTSSLDDVLGRVKPVGDPLAIAQARERVASNLFDRPAEPVRLGKFELLERLGRGGMGTVYSAHDTELDRPVALKLLHERAEGESDRAYRRLLREARALAPLSHPNVVPVHEVGTSDGRVFLVMELVVGQTLRAWLAGAKRSWREVLNAYIQAGEGLAAAHAKGIVHRDFKPDNALIGDDGRVRVVDFGLARGRLPAEPATPGAPETSPGERTTGDHGTPAPKAGRERSPAQVSADGSLSASRIQLGTPFYTAPEQYYEGPKVSAAADQFSFCVSLYGAVYGQRPFAGDNPREFMESVRNGSSVREPPRERRVPRRVHKALCVGLSKNPGDRHASMTALLDELRRALGQTRRRVVAGVAGIAVVAILAFFAFGRERHSTISVCDGGRARLAEVWNPERRADVDDAFHATGHAYASERASSVRAGLDNFGRKWVTTYRDACVRRQKDEWSDELRDRSVGCLERRLHTFESAIAQLKEIKANSLDNALPFVLDLESQLVSCADTTTLMAEVRQPDQTVVERVTALRKRLDTEVVVPERFGRFEEALDTAKNIVGEAEQLEYDPVLAESLLAQGRVAMMSNQPMLAVEALERAATLGVRQEGTLSLAVEALARGIFVLGTRDDESARQSAFRLISIAEGLSERPALHRSPARSLLLGNIGAVYMIKEDRERAYEYYERFAEALERIPSPPLELRRMRTNLAMLTRDPTRREQLIQEVLEELEQQLGPSHPWALDARLAYARYTPDPNRARSLLAPACKKYERLPDEQVKLRIHCLYYLGFLTAEHTVVAGASRSSDNDHARAIPILKQAARLDKTNRNGERMPWSHLAHGWALYYGGQYAKALNEFQLIHDRFVDKAEAWYVWIATHARLGMGITREALGEFTGAVEDLRRAAAVFESPPGIGENVEHAQRLAVARAALARIELRERKLVQP